MYFFDISKSTLMNLFFQILSLKGGFWNFSIFFSFSFVFSTRRFSSKLISVWSRMLAEVKGSAENWFHGKIFITFFATGEWRWFYSVKLGFPALRVFGRTPELHSPPTHFSTPFWSLFRVPASTRDPNELKKVVFTCRPLMVSSEMSPDVVVLKLCNGNSSLYGALKNHGIFG